MFTGIISELGKIVSIDRDASGATFTIRALMTSKDVKIGDSVAVNGACHTVVRKTASSFVVQSVPETLDRTNLGDINVDSFVNLELPMLASGRFDGHVVTGHIDATARVSAITTRGNSVELTFVVPQKCSKYIVEKGSVALDGMSLTVARLVGTCLTIAVIPHTWAVTNLSSRAVGDRVNLETDILAKHVAKLIR